MKIKESTKYNKQNIRKNILLFIFAILSPSFAIIIFLAVKQIYPWNISIPCSFWNDELFYYKQIQGMIEYGLSRGYWGYNESHSILGNFAGWNPTTLFPYVIAGKILGWNYWTPIVFNWLAWTIAFVLFYLICSDWIDAKGQMWILLTFASYGIGLRYVFSMTPESLMAVLLLIYSGLVFRLYKTNETWVFIVSCLLMAIMILVRGYYAAFALVIAAITLKNKSYKRCAIISAVILFSAVGFVFIEYFFTAPYFFDTVSYSSLVNPRFFLHLMKEGVLQTWDYIRQAFMRESIRGSWYISYVVAGVCAFFSLKKRDIVSISVALVWWILIIAMWVLYNPKEGSRQLMNCALVGLMLIMAFSKKVPQIAKFLVLVCLVFCTYLSKDTFFGSLPVKNEERLQSINSIDLSESMIISDEDWDNTIDMSMSMDFRDMYAAPIGFGLNYCYDDYLMSNYDSLKAKYVATLRGSEVDRFFDEKCKLISSYGATNIYAVR